MAFDAIAPGRRGGSTALAPNEVGVAHYLQTNSGPSLQISIGADVLRRLGWKVGNRVLASEGSGTDAGLMQIVRVETGGHALSSNGGSDSPSACVRFLSSLLRHHVPPADMRTLTRVEVQAFGGQMLIMLPDWLKPKQG